MVIIVTRLKPLKQYMWNYSRNGHSRGNMDFFSARVVEEPKMSNECLYPQKSVFGVQYGHVLVKLLL